jgi:hypothetical protein
MHEDQRARTLARTKISAHARVRARARRSARTHAHARERTEEQVATGSTNDVDDLSSDDGRPRKRAAHAAKARGVPKSKARTLLPCEPPPLLGDPEPPPLLGDPEPPPPHLGDVAGSDESGGDAEDADGEDAFSADEASDGPAAGAGIVSGLGY